MISDLFLGGEGMIPDLFLGGEGMVPDLFLGGERGKGNDVQESHHFKEKSESLTGVPTQCLGGHGFDSCQGLRFFFVPCSCHVD